MQHVFSCVTCFPVFSECPSQRTNLLNIIQYVLVNVTKQFLAISRTFSLALCHMRKLHISKLWVTDLNISLFISYKKNWIDVVTWPDMAGIKTQVGWLLISQPGVLERRKLCIVRLNQYMVLYIFNPMLSHHWLSFLLVPYWDLWMMH